MTLQEYQQAVCNALAPHLQRHGVEALAENALDVDARIAEALGGVGAVAVVMTPALEYAGLSDGGAMLWSVDELVVAVREQPPVNRSRPGAATASEIALLAAAALASDTLTPQRITVRELDGELLAEAALASSAYIEGLAPATSTTED